MPRCSGSSAGVAHGSDVPTPAPSTRSDERQPLLAARAAARSRGVRRAARSVASATATRRRRAPRSTRHAAAGEVADRLGDDADASLRCSSTKSRSTGAPWPGHHHGRRRRAGRARCRGVSGHSNGQQSPPNDGGAGLLDQVAGEQHVGVGHPHDQVAARCGRGRGAPARPAGRRGRGPAREENVLVGRHDLGGSRTSSRVRVVGLVGVRCLIRSPDCDGALGGRSRGRGSGSRRTPSRNAPLPKVWSKCSWVLTIAGHSPAPRRRTSSTTSRAATVGAVGVDDQQPAVAADQGDVDVEPVVAGDPDPVGDLGEAGSWRETP